MRASGAQFEILAERFRAPQAIERRIARAKIEIDIREIGMGQRAPGGFDHFGGPSQIASMRQETPGQGGGRNEIGRELHGRLCARERALPVALGPVEGIGRQEHGPVPLGDALVHQPERGAALDRVEGSAPIPRGAMRLEHGVACPVRRGSEADGLGGVLGRGPGIAPAAGLDEQAAQPEHPGFVVVHHAGEGGFRRGAVAGDLGRLRLQQERERLLPEESFGLGGIAPGRDAVACPDRDHAARNRLEAPGAATGPRREAHAGRQAQERAHRRPHER